MEIDCRSDTVTQPSAAMRKAMAEAPVGDDVFREDPTVLALESAMAAELGKEAALFVPTGSMGNLICVMVHCWGRGQEIILGDRSHIHVYEQGTIAQFGGVHHRTVTNLDNGTFSLDEMKAKIRHDAPDDPHDPITTLVCIENSHNKCGGRAVPLDWIDQLAETCRSFNLPIHCDGARLFNTATAIKVPASRLVRDCDSVSVCLSKGLGAPIGSVIVGSKSFIAKAVRVRKALGGGMRQVGIIAAAGLFAIQNNIGRLHQDHDNARKVAKTVQNHGQGIAIIDESTVDTNLVFVKIEPKIMGARDFVDRMLKTSNHPMDKASIKIIDFDPQIIRISFHIDITDEMAEIVCDKLKFVFEELRKK